MSQRPGPVSPTKHVVIVGGGWAGYGAASHLTKAGLHVTILEAQPVQGGLAAGWQTANGRQLEVGVHGFWRSYRNIFRLISTELGLDVDALFTPFTPSALYTRDGLSVVAPILGSLPQLPTPIGTGIFTEFRRLSLMDKATALPLLYEFIDFDGAPDAWEAYDRMTARELFSRAGVSRKLYEEFLEPMLLVLPMCPGEDCSAAAALSLFQYFALAHQADFDVRWLRGPASETVFRPWRESIERMGGRVLGGKRVSDLQVEGGAITSVGTLDGDSFEADAVILAVGISGAKGIVRQCPALARLPQFSAMMNLRGVDVVAVRLFFNRRLAFPHASNVAGGGMAPGLSQTGLTFYHLNDLQDAYKVNMGSVVEVDFFYASSLLGASDDQVVDQALAALTQAVPGCGIQGRLGLEDFGVVRAAQGVSHFSPGSYQHLPSLHPAPDSIHNLWMCGDWVDRGGHRSWSQEKALVTGRQAAAAVCRQLGVRQGQDSGVLDVEQDEAHIIALRKLNAARKQVEASFPFPLPPPFGTPSRAQSVH